MPTADAPRDLIGRYDWCSRANDGERLAPAKECGRRNVPRGTARRRAGHSSRSLMRPQEPNTLARVCAGLAGAVLAGIAAGAAAPDNGFGSLPVMIICALI